MFFLWGAYEDFASFWQPALIGSKVETYLTLSITPLNHLLWLHLRFDLTSLWSHKICIPQHNLTVI